MRLHILKSTSPFFKVVTLVFQKNTSRSDGDWLLSLNPMGAHSTALYAQFLQVGLAGSEALRNLKRSKLHPFSLGGVLVSIAAPQEKHGTADHQTAARPTLQPSQLTGN
jgi:hypothetical protein